jgi:hypothetical protein
MAEEIPVIKFKPIRYSDHLAQRELWAKMEAGEKTDIDETIWVMGMVTEWNLLDAETGAPIPTGEYLPLTLIQHAQVFNAWNAHAAQSRDAVKKTRETE